MRPLEEIIHSETKKDNQMQKQMKIKALPKPMPLIGSSVAVVLSTPEILTRTFGKEIDEHDEVFRFNLFETKGFERYCGAKTTTWVCYDYAKAAWLDKEFWPRLDTIFEELGDVKKFTTPHFFGAPRTKEMAGGWYLTKEHFDELVNLFGHASSGVRILYALIQSGVKPDLYGFEPFDSETYRHYWCDIAFMKEATKAHNWRKEKDWIIEQHEKGNLVIKK